MRSCLFENFVIATSYSSCTGSYMTTAVTDMSCSTIEKYGQMGVSIDCTIGAPPSLHHRNCY